MIQEVIVGLMVAVAVVYIVRKYIWKPKGKDSACGACCDCDGKEKKGGCH